MSVDSAPNASGAAQSEINRHLWEAGRYLRWYKHASLQPAEALILTRYRTQLSARVLDVGCGGGRILAYLLLLGADAHGIDISARMVEHCRNRYPDATVNVGDLPNLGATVTGPFDSILLADNVLDVFDDAQRRRVLTDIRGLLAPGGLLVFSSHNLANWDREPSASDRRPIGSAQELRRDPCEAQHRLAGHTRCCAHLAAG